MTGFDINEIMLRQRPQLEMPGFRSAEPNVFDSLFRPSSNEPDEPERPVPLIDRILQRENEEADQRLLQSLRSSMEIDPDLAAEAQRLAIQTGQNALAIEGNIERVRALMGRERVRRMIAAGYNPTLARQLEDPEFARIAHDDLLNLGYWEVVGANWEVGKLQVERGKLGSLKRSGQLTDAGERRLAWINDRMQRLPGVEGFLSGAAKILGQQSVTFPEALSYGGAVGGVYAAGAAIAGQAGPQAAAPEEAVTVPAAFLIGTGKGTAAAMFAIAAVNEGGNQYLDLLDNNVDPRTAWWVSQAYGLGAGALEMVGVGKVTGPVRGRIMRSITRETAEALRRPTQRSAVTQFALEYAEAVGGEVSTEIGQEILGIVADEVGRSFGAPEGQQGQSWREILERVGGVARDTFYGMAVLGLPGPAGGYLAERSRIQRSQENVKQVASWAQAAKESKVRGRRPDVFEKHIEASLDGTGAENIYIGADKLDEVLEQNGVTRETLRESMPEVARQLDEADAAKVKADVDVVIPNARYQTKLAPLDLHEQMKPHLRVSPEDLSAFELAQAQGVVQQMEQALPDTVQEEVARVQAYVREARAVKDDIVTQLSDAGMSRRDANAAATLRRDFVLQWARRAGLQPQEAYDQIRTTIVAAEYAERGESQLDQAAQISTPEFRAWFGGSLATEDGERGSSPRVYYHGTNQDFTVFDREAAQRVFGHSPSMDSVGSWFSTSSDAAQNYASNAAVVPVYLAIRRPARMSFDEFLEMGQMTDFEFDEDTQAPGGFDGAAVRDHLQREGFDGIVFTDSSIDGFDQEVWVAFEPDQIKSAIANRGTFDPNDPSILNQHGTAVDPRVVEDERWRKHQPEKTAGGKVKGAPEWVRSQKDMPKLRRQLRGLAEEGGAGRFWYENSARAVLEMVGGDVVLAEKFIQLLAIYSPKTNVWTNTLQAVRAFTHWRLGRPAEDLTVGTGVMDGKAIEVLYQDKPFEGRKTSSFYLNLMHEIVHTFPEQASQLALDPEILEALNGPATIDLWMYRAFGYRNEQGADDRGSGRYSFSENEVRRLAAELNAEQSEGMPRWTPHQVQAAVWTAMKTRYELKDVKQATEEKSEREGHITFKKGVRVVINRAEHLANWRAFAMQVGSDRAREASNEAARSFAEDMQRMTEVITWEAIPSPALGHPITSATPDEQRRFTEEAKGLLFDEDGNDALAAQLGVALSYSAEGFGAYAGAVAPNVLAHLLPARGKGAKGFPVDEVRAYSRAIQFIFMQDAVPWFRPENRPLTSKKAREDQQFRVLNPSGRTVPKGRFDSLADAEAEAARRGEGFTVRGGALARAVVLRFNGALDEKRLADVLAELQKHLGEDAGYTRTAENEIVVVNFRDDETGIPFARHDEDFIDLMSDFVAAGREQLEISEHGALWTQGEYGGVHDWATDSEGQALLDDGAFAGRPDLQAWLRDRREAFAQLLDGHRQSPESRDAERESLVELAQQPGRRDGGRVRVVGRQPARRYGRRGRDSAAAVGVHFSDTRRASVDGTRYDDRLRAGERGRLERADPRLRNRVHFYVDTGNGVRPADGVGGVAHVVALDNLYDTEADPLGFMAASLDERGADPQSDYQSALELRVLEAGFDGLLMPDPEGQQSLAVLIGEHSKVPVQPLDETELASGRKKNPKGGFRPATFETLLYEEHDGSTVVHEAAHWFLESTLRLVRTQLAQPMKMGNRRLQDDVRELFDWLEVGDYSQPLAERVAIWDSLPPAEWTRRHEAFAYNFEIYLHEGRAPTEKLQSVFDRVAGWMRRLYNSIVTELNAVYAENHGGEDLPMLTDEVRQVFDRMLASEQEIQEQQAAEGMGPLFAERPDGMSDEEWEDIQLASEAMTNSAVSQLTREKLREGQWLSRARGRMWREAQRQHDEMRAQLEAEIRATLEQEPVHRARRLIGKAQSVEQDGEVVDVEFPKINTTEAHAILGEDTDLRVALPGLTAPDGAFPDHIAEMLPDEWSSGEELLLALKDEPDIDTAVARAVDQRMLAENLPTQEEQQAQIDRALMSESHARLAAMELRFLTKGLQPVRLMVKAARLAARDMLQDRPISQIQPHQHALTAARAAREAERAMSEGKVAEAIAAKRRQLVQTQLAAEGAKIKADVDRQVRDFRKFWRSDAKLGKSRNVDFIAIGRALLTRHKLGRGDAAAADHLRDLEAYNPQLYAAMEPIITKTSGEPSDYRDLTPEQWRDTAELIDSMWNQAQRDNQIRVEGELMELGEAVAQLDEQLEAVGATEPTRREHGVTDRERTGMDFNRLKALLRRVEHWTHTMDGGKAGPFTRYIWRPIRQAVDRYVADRVRFTKKVHERLAALELDATPIDAKEIGWTFGKTTGHGQAELIGALLHIGNASNKAKLLHPRGWGKFDQDTQTLDDTQWQRFFDRMVKEGKITKAHMDFVQFVWDTNEQLKNEHGQPAHFDLFGHRFKEIEAVEVQTPWGTYSGGYVPANIDREESNRLDRAMKLEQLEGDHRSTQPTAGVGFYKMRTDQLQHPLDLDVRKVVVHIDDVLRFSHIQPAARDVMRVLRHDGFRDRLANFDRFAVSEMLEPWLMRSARQSVSVQGMHPKWDAFWRMVRRRTGVAFLFANVRNALQQLTGLFLSSRRVKGRYLAKGFWRWARNPMQAQRDAADLSSWIDERQKGQVYEISEAMNEILANPSKFNKLDAWSKRHGYFIQVMFQNVVDTITFHGAFEQAMDQAGVETTDETAIAEATQVAEGAVRMTQGSFEPTDVAKYEAASPAARAFTQFSGYFNTVLNLNSDEFTKIVRESGWTPAGFGKLFYAYLMGFAMPMIGSELIVQLMGQWDGDDEDGYNDEMMDILFLGQLRGAFALVPAAGQIGVSVVNAFDDKFYNDRMATSPAIAALESLTFGTVRTAKKFLDRGEIDTMGLRDGALTASLISGVPFTALARPFAYQWDVNAGKTTPRNLVDYGRGLLTGTGPRN